MPKQQQQQNFRRSSRLVTVNAAKLQQEESSKKKQELEKSLSQKKSVKDEIPNEGSHENSASVAEAILKVFGNNLFLSHIFKKLRTCDLIDCRLVNSLWKETATFIINQRKDLKAIDIRFEANQELFLLNSLKHHELSELQNILENSANFPCDEFKIEGPLEHPDLQKFLSSSKCGGQIKIKKLNLDFTTTCLSRDMNRSKDRKRNECIIHFRKLLTEQLVNLNSLILHTINFDCTGNPTKMKLLPSPVIFPNLTHLEISCYSWRFDEHLLMVEFIWTDELLKACPSLKSFSTGRIEEATLEGLIELKKCNLLTELVIARHSSCADDDEILSPFKLKKLTATSQYCDYFGYTVERYRQPSRADISPDPSVRSAFLNLLHLNVDVLTSLSLEIHDATFSLPTSIVFHNVKTFCVIGFDFNDILQHHDEDWSKIRIYELFPNLEKIRLEGNFNAERCGVYTEQNLPFLVTAPMEKVKTLEIQHVCPVEWLKLLPTTFPNVEHLILENYWDFPKSGSLFWSFPSLKSIDMGLLFGIDNIDSVFTGFSPDTCQRLKISTNRALAQLVDFGTMEIETEDEIKELRVGPSILQLKELRELRIRVADTDPQPRDLFGIMRASKTRVLRSRKRLFPFSPPNFDLMSSVTAIYAFGMIPSLEGVEISIVPNETRFLPLDPKGSLRRLRKLESALLPMAEHPLVTLNPIQLNN